MDFHKKFESETGITIIRTQEQLDYFEKHQDKPIISLGQVENKYTEWLERKLTEIKGGR